MNQACTTSSCAGTQAEPTPVVLHCLCQLISFIASLAGPSLGLTRTGMHWPRYPPYDQHQQLKQQAVW